MSQYSSQATGRTPTVSATDVNTNVLYNTVVSAIALVKAINWGGSDTSLVAQVSGVGRVTNTPATPTAWTIIPANTAAGPAPISLSAFFTTAATAVSNATGARLFQQNWNSQGGGGVVVLPIGGEWLIAGGALGVAGDAIGWGSSVGGGANLSFGFIWAE